ncbi:MAG: hydantoinase/oxoprolinase family protein [Xanthomonadales bacterium]|nr:hydantoinase/oxoprolinase family protein [Xanthomonadales bacterium]
MLRAGIDIGGTFTDLVMWDDDGGQPVIHKLPSTPDDPAVAGIEGLKALLKNAGRDAAELDFLCHGTTVATNILLEKNGADVGMITTQGFRDVLHIGRKNRPLNFSHAQDVPRQSQPLVKRRNRIPVAERIRGPDGSVETPLDEQAVVRAVRALRERDVDAIAVCCLMSFLNPVHELRIREIVEREFPGAYLSVSHQVSPLYREYERFSTTALNAYVGPRTARYLDRFAASLGELGVNAGLNLMTSAGGMVPASEARQSPVSLLLSGPVGALILGIQVGRQVGHPSVITLDVGGTSADIGVAPDGDLRMKHLLDTRVGDYDAMMPMVDIDTIGAGGGSLAFIDEGGMFRVGPRSAGARPGPACYGQGGIEPTVTDAMVELGWFREIALEESGLTIDPQLARRAIQQHIAGPLGLEVTEAAAGIYRIAVNNMVEAIRVNSVSKGYDPRDFALVAEGGAGAAFAVYAARELAIPLVIVPVSPGVGAAAGLLCTDTKYEYRNTLWQKLDDADNPSVHQRIEASYIALERHALTQLKSSGVSEERTSLRFMAECRYAGQGYELTVEVPAPPVDESWIARVVEAFHRAHERAYLRRFEDKPVMIINVGLAAIGAVTALRSDTIAAGSQHPEPSARIDQRTVSFLDGHGSRPFEARFYRRAALKAGNVLAGPAVIEQPDTTTVLPPGSTARVDALGNLIITFVEPQDE